MSEWTLLGWSWWEAILVSCLVGAGTGLMVREDFVFSMGAWLLTLALRMVFR